MAWEVQVRSGRAKGMEPAAPPTRKALPRPCYVYKDPEGSGQVSFRSSVKTQLPRLMGTGGGSWAGARAEASCVGVNRPDEAWLTDELADVLSAAANLPGSTCVDLEQQLCSATNDV